MRNQQLVKFYCRYHLWDRNLQSSSLMLCIKLLDLLKKVCCKRLRCLIPHSWLICCCFSFSCHAIVNYQRLDNIIYLFCWLVICWIIFLSRNNWNELTHPSHYAYSWLVLQPYFLLLPSICCFTAVALM